MHTTTGGVSVTISVVIPVYNAAQDLDRCLSALSGSLHKLYECIVVDDGSTDDSREVARRHGARVIAMTGNSGPACARNRGAEAARGDVLLFLDADVCVHPETVGRIATAFARDVDVAALMGSYDDQPGSPFFLSQYKNLFHHYVHQNGKEEASTFWSGCGAVRRTLFLAMGGFNEGYAKPCIEDIELGFRLRRAGHRIRLDRDVQAKHLKCWDLVNLVKTDLFLRGVPWVALMLRDRRAVKDLNLSWHSRVCTVLTYLLALTLVALAGTGRAVVTLPALAVVGLGVMSVLLHDRAAKRIWRWSPAVGLAVLVPAMGAAGAFELPALLPLGLLLVIVAIHYDFYRFFARVRGLSFAVGVVPMHLLFFLYSGLAIPLGILAHLSDQRQAREEATGPGRILVQPLKAESSSAQLLADDPQLIVEGTGKGIFTGRVSTHP
jgi:GT2 family glycosyltransferase